MQDAVQLEERIEEIGQELPASIRKVLKRGGIMVECPHCGAKRPIYTAYASVPPTNPMRDYGQSWVKIAWQTSIDYPKEIKYTRNCDRQAGPLEVVRCSECGHELVDEEGAAELRAMMYEIIGRVRLQSDEEFIEFLKELAPGRNYGQNTTIQMPDLIIDRNRLIGYIRECEVRLGRFGLNQGGLYHRHEHDWRSMIKFIKQAERLERYKWPRPPQDGGTDDLGLAVVQIMPNGQMVVRSGHPMMRRAEINDATRWEICGTAYHWKLSYPDQSFMIRQIGDFSQSGLVGGAYE